MRYRCIRDIVMFCARILLIALLLENEWAVGTDTDSTTTTKSADLTDSVGEPLILTSYIEAGDIETARDLASVTLEGFSDIVSYAGYLTIDEAHGSNSYFWFFPAQESPETAPVILWLQGGPGLTTLYGVLLEHGPFHLTSNLTLEPREHPWTKSHNVIYLESPIGTGFSFTESSDGYRTNETQIGEDVVAAITQFFQLFPEYVDNDFFATGESYGGKYVPAVATAIANYNSCNEQQINLQGLMIFAGLTDPINQMTYGDFYYQQGLIDSRGRESFYLLEETIRQLLRDEDFLEARQVFFHMIFGISGNTSLLDSLTGFTYHYNLLQTTIPSEVFDIVKWAQKEDTRSALHVGNTQIDLADPDVRTNLQYDYMQSAATQIAALTEAYRVIFLHGQFDLVIPYTSIENALANLQWYGSDEWIIAEREILRVNEELIGYAKNAYSLTEVFVRCAGHALPTDQPEWTLNIVTNFTRNLSL